MQYNHDASYLNNKIPTLPKNAENPTHRSTYGAGVNCDCNTRRLLPHQVEFEALDFEFMLNVCGLRV